MPFRQPTPIILRYFHFRGKTYDFPVESVLTSKPGNGQLHIETSLGYGLTTLGNSTPQSWQTLSYVSQADGSWLAQGRLTLVATGSSLIDGTVTLRDPIGEILNLLVCIESVLFVEGSTVTFSPTQPTEATITFLKIRQQGATTPVSLAIQESNQFALATNTQEADFASKLTISISFTGTYIYIRYAPDRSGRHVARLLITTPYDTKTVTLEGQASSVRAGYRLVEWSDLLPPWRVPSNQPTVSSIRMWVLSALLLGLGYGGYIYRCALAPSLCQSQTTVKTTQSSGKRALVKTGVATGSVNKKKLITHSTKKPTINEMSLSRQSKSDDIPRFVEKANTRGRLKAKGRVLLKRKPKRGVLAQMKPIKIEQESDLEKELNSKPLHKH